MAANTWTLAMALLGVVIAERPGRIRRSVLLLFIAAASLSAVVFSLNIRGIWVGLTMPYFNLVLMGGTGIVQAWCSKPAAPADASPAWSSQLSCSCPAFMGSARRPDQRRAL